ncbi:MAG: hypothetical protein AAGG01_03595 [Planctomycetota bacterium]
MLSICTAAVLLGASLAPSALGFSPGSVPGSARWSGNPPLNSWDEHFGTPPYSVIKTEDDRAGLSGFLISAAAQAGVDRGMEGKHVITLARSSFERLLALSAWRVAASLGSARLISRGNSTRNTPLWA